MDPSSPFQGSEAESATSRRKILLESQLYFVCSGSSPTAQLATRVEQAIRGGVTIVQLREHNISDSGLLERARALREITRRLGALFIVNDRADVALISEADGVHVGQDDIAPEEIRTLIGPEMLLGLSTHSKDDIEAAQEGTADYIGVGPVYQTPTKEGRKGVGLELVRYAAVRSRIPFFAIGGIDRDSAQKVLEAGARRIAVVRAIENSPSPEEATRALLEVMRQKSI